jgi:hypothetical protein
MVYPVQMTDKHDKFQLLKSKYLEQVRSKEKELDALKTKLQVIQELEAESEKLEVPLIANGAYRGLGLTDAVLDAVGILGVGNGVSATGVVKHLLAQGFQPKGKNFTISVGTTLKRLAKSRIKTELRDGNRLYMPK